MTLTYNPNLAKVKADPYAKYQDQRSNGSAVRAHTDRRTDGRTDGRTLPYLPRFVVDNKYDTKSKTRINHIISIMGRIKVIFIIIITQSLV